MVYNVNYRMSSREEILAAAAETFRYRGFEASGVAEILKRAGYKPPTLYYHFGDKEGLYVSWCETALAELGAALHEVQSASQIAAVLIDAKYADPVAIRRDLGLMSRKDSRERILQALGVNVDEPMTNVFFAMVQAEGEPELLDVWITGLLGAISAMRVPAPRGKALAAETAVRWAIKAETGWRRREAKVGPDHVE
ncbi:MAG: hypothetical protein HONBIEJF_01223 [Fimbriimonadaceae bacterium]|nr:hypothetical protein [Fimbriimonadaceae bacterium]